MTRRRWMVVTAGAGWIVTRGVGASSIAGVVAESRVELRVANEPGEAPFTLEEFDSAGQAGGKILCEDARTLSSLLSRVLKRPSGPRDLRLIVADGSTMVRVQSAVKACQTSGFERVKISGCLPQGGGIAAGQTRRQRRYDENTLNCATLGRILAENSAKC